MEQTEKTTAINQLRLNSIKRMALLMFLNDKKKMRKALDSRYLVIF
jgi:hypothetical protein